MWHPVPRWLCHRWVMAEVSPLTPAARGMAAELLAALPDRWRHVQGVAAEANLRAARLTAQERDAVSAAAWLHDIGYADTIAVTGLHALDGAVHLAKLGVHVVVVGLVAFHTGAEVEADERGLREQLDAMPRPATHLLDVLTAADLSVDPCGRPIQPKQRIVEILNRYELTDPVHRAVVRSQAALLAAVNRADAAGSADVDL